MRSALVPILLADPMPWAFKAPYAWDFLRDRARFAGGYRGALANTPNWTFTRASTAYYTNSAGVLTSVASGVLRTGDRGALIEGAGTNLCLQSQTFDNASWSKVNATVTADAIAAPDGTTTADKLVTGAAVNSCRVQQTFTLSATTTYTLSIYAKAAEWSWLQFRVAEDSAHSCWFDIGTGALGSSEASWTGATITPLANGWYRCTAKYTTVGTSYTIRIIATNANGGSSTGDGTSGIYLWGAQLEATAYASSYVPTTTGSATRAADSLTVTGVSGLDYPLTPYAEFERASDTVASAVALRISDAGGTHNARLSVNSSDLAQAYCEAASVAQVSTSFGGAISVGQTAKLALRYDLNDSVLAASGLLGTVDTSCSLPAAPTRVQFGYDGGGQPLVGYLRRAALFSRALSDGELQALTAA